MIAAGEVEFRLASPLRLGQGDFFGELALLTEAWRGPLIVAAESCELLALPAADFRALASSEPELTQAINRTRSFRLQDPTKPPVGVLLKRMLKEEMPRGAEPARPLPHMATRRHTAPAPVASAKTLPDIDAVGFGVAHPAAVAPATPFVVEAWLFQHADRELAEKRALERFETGARFRPQGSAAITRGARLTVSLKIVSWQVEPKQQSIVWTGDICNIAFAVTPDAAPTAERVTGHCRISLDGLRICNAVFELDIAGAPRPNVSVTQGTRIKSAFASYAAADRRRVLARVQGIEKAGIDVFMDVRSLKAGDNFNTELLRQIDRSDVLYLFWSRSAAQSEWVAREWRYGFEKKGLTFIDPIPLTNPRRVPPPPELAREKHFNDWTLAYLEAPRLWDRVKTWIIGD